MIAYPAEQQALVAAAAAVGAGAGGGDEDFGGGGGGGGFRRPPRGGDDDRGERKGRGRHRDGLGTPERRSPTPPEAVPLSQRKRKASGWDVHAPGYEQYTAMQAKQTGE